MNKSIKIDQQTFLHVKQRLDYYHLPVNFPFEMTNLLHKMLQLIDQHQNQKIYQTQNQRYQELKNSNQDNHNNKPSSFSPAVDEALRLELSKHLKENNELHMEIITLKEQLSALKHANSKTFMQNSTLKNLYSTENGLIQQGHLSRQNQFFDQLEDAKYKYNLLLDQIHSDANKQKCYIKKLLKHKRYCLSFDQKNKSKSAKGGFTQTGISNDHHQSGRKFSCNHHSQFQYQIKLLNEKLSNRQKEILRLQKKLQFDGLNMNRILKDFNQHKAKEQGQKTNQIIQVLEKQLKSAKDQNSKIKRQSGDRQALRENIQKLKAENKQLKQKVEQFKRKFKQVEIDEKNLSKLNSRKSNEAADKLNSLMKQKAKSDTRNEELEKKEESLQNLNKQLATKLVQAQSKINKLLQQKETLIKQFENQILMNEYERQQNVRRLADLTDQLKISKEQQKINNLNLLKQNQLLRQSVNHLEQAQQENQNKNLFLLQNQIAVKNQAQKNSFVDLWKLELTELKNKLYSKDAELAKVNNQLLNLKLFTERLQKDHDCLLTENLSLRNQTLVFEKIECTASEMKHQLASCKDLLEHERAKTAKYQTQLSQYDKITQQFNLLKEQYFTLQKGQKQKIRSLELQIASLQETINLKIAKNEQKDWKVKSLQVEFIQSSEKLRKVNRELSTMDEQLHRVKIDKSRLQKKYNQLLADFTAQKQSEKKNLAVKQLHLLAQIEKLSRDLSRNNILIEETQLQVQELTIQKAQLQRQNQELSKLVDCLKQEIQNNKQRQQLYELEIRELKRINY